MIEKSCLGNIVIVTFVILQFGSLETSSIPSDPEYLPHGHHSLNAYQIAMLACPSASSVPVAMA
jgi:hypothetical protein